MKNAFQKYLLASAVLGFVLLTGCGNHSYDNSKSAQTAAEDTYYDEEAGYGFQSKEYAETEEADAEDSVKEVPDNGYKGKTDQK